MRFKKFNSLITAILLFLIIFSSCNSDSNASSETETKTDIKEVSYEDRLFDDSYVHEINIILSEEDKTDLITRALEKNKYIADVEIDGEYFSNVRVSTKGSSTLYETAMEDGVDCYSLKLSFEYDDVENSYYGLNHFCLNNNKTDDSKLFDHIAYLMYDSLGIPSSLTSYVHVTLNGENYGILLAVEEPDKAFMKRNNINNDAELYKPNSLFVEGYVSYKCEKAQEAKDNGTVDEFVKLHSDLIESLTIYMQIFFEENKNKGMYNGSDFIYTDDDPEHYSDIFDYSIKKCSDNDKKKVIEAIKNLSENNVEEALVTDKVISYFVCHNFQINWDGPSNKHNFYLLEDEGKLMFIPWDNNLAMTSEYFYSSGLSEKELYEYPMEDVMTLLRGDDHPMWKWILTEDRWISEYYDAADKLLIDYLESGKCMDEIERVNEMLRPYIEKDDSNMCTLEEYDTAVNNLKTFIIERSACVRSQVDEYNNKVA